MNRSRLILDDNISSRPSKKQNSQKKLTDENNSNEYISPAKMSKITRSGGSVGKFVQIDY